MRLSPFPLFPFSLPVTISSSVLTFLFFLFFSLLARFFFICCLGKTLLPSIQKPLRRPHKKRDPNDDEPLPKETHRREICATSRAANLANDQAAPPVTPALSFLQAKRNHLVLITTYDYSSCPPHTTAVSGNWLFRVTLPSSRFKPRCRCRRLHGWVP